VRSEGQSTVDVRLGVKRLAMLWKKREVGRRVFSTRTVSFCHSMLAADQAAPCSSAWAARYASQPSCIRMGTQLICSPAINLQTFLSSRVQVRISCRTAPFVMNVLITSRSVWSTMPRCAAGSPVTRRVYGCERAVSSLPSIVTRLYLAYVPCGKARGTNSWYRSLPSSRLATACIHKMPLHHCFMPGPVLSKARTNVVLTIDICQNLEFC
jgi:hypothetical protein